MNSKSRRGGFKSWLVEPYRQVKLGLMFLLVNLMFSLLILSIFGYYTFDIYSSMAEAFKLSPEESSLILNKFMFPVAAGSALMIAFVCITIFISVRYTHEIYGPLVSIQRFLDELLYGKNPDRLTLRSSDQLQGLAEQLNKLATNLKGDEKFGALIVINRYIDGLIEGKKPEKIKLRDNDPFKELAEKLNKLS